MITNPKELGRNMERLCRYLPKGVHIRFSEKDDRFSLDFDSKESIPLDFTGEEPYSEIKETVFAKLN